MPTTTGIGLVVTMALLLQCISGDVTIVAQGVTVEFTCTGPADKFQPTWLVNGTRPASNENFCYRLTYKERPQGELNATAILTIKGNQTCNILNVYCRIHNDPQFLYLYNTTLTVQGHLPSPESVHINETVNSSTIEWNPPYSSLNNDIVHVDPRITHYTVYVTAQNMTDKTNITETWFTFNPLDYGLCLLYHVSAWNVGGEGEMSVPVCTPHIPCKVAAGSVVIQATVQELQIDLNVTEPCEVRRPNFLHITVVTFGRVAVNTTTVPHDRLSGPQVTVRVELPQNVNMCNLLVSIRAGNSAGMSSPTEIKVECPTTSDSAEGAPTTSTITDANTTVVTDGTQQAEDTSIVPISVGAVVAVLVITAAVGVAIGVVFALWKGNRKGKRSGENIGSSTTATANTSNAIVEIRSSGVVYADVEALQRKIKPPPDDDNVQYQTVLPQPVIADPTLPPKAGGIPSDTTPPDDKALGAPAFNEEFSAAAGGEEEGLGKSSNEAN